MRKLRVLDLFSGIGGFSLGLERTGGFETVAFCEIEEFPRRVLAKHWPEVPCYHDVRELTAARLAADGIAIDVICGGFPCQDISTAGGGSGIEGERSGLWADYARLVGEIRPRFVLVENVAALLGRGLDRVLGDLAKIGYDAEWYCIPASAVGAPHRRDRIWIVAYPNSQRELQPEGCVKDERGWPGDCRQALADAISYRLQGERFVGSCQQESRASEGQKTAGSGRSFGPSGSWWSVEPNVGRVADGVPDRSHRLKGLGNAVVPQIPELIGYAILDAIREERKGEAA